VGIDPDRRDARGEVVPWPSNKEARTLFGIRAFQKATSGLEPLVEVLQTPGLTTCLRRRKAGDGTRTRDALLGKQVFYH
jgi:hypothetical protein